MSPEARLLLRGADADQARPVDLVRSVPEPGPVIPLAIHDPHREDAVAAERRQGFAQGLAEGREQAAREGLRARRELAAGIDRTLDDLRRSYDERYRELAADVGRLAVAVAEAVLGRELELAADPGGDAIRRCLDLVPDDGALVIRLHPDDVDTADVIELMGRDVTVVADAGFGRGDTVIAFDEGTVDGRLAQALERVREALQ